MSELLPVGENRVVRATETDIEFAPVPAADVDSGTPQQGIAALGDLGSVRTGIWELRGGTVRDTEADELFVVLSGEATIELLDEARTVTVQAGDVMRLVAGTRTRWTVADHIRKVYIA